MSDDVGALLEVAAAQEVVEADLCLRLARAHLRAGEPEGAVAWAVRVVDAGDDPARWKAAADVVGRAGGEDAGAARVAVLGSSTTTTWLPLLRLAALRRGIPTRLYEAPFGQYRQSILDPGSDLYRFNPDVVILAVDHHEIGAPDGADDVERFVGDEVDRWASLWELLGERTRARVVHHLFAIPPDEPLGHLAARTRHSRRSVLQAVNAGLGAAAGDRVALVDCDRLAAAVGTNRWFDDRWWHHAKQAVSPAGQPILARHTAAVVAAIRGRARKVAVVDLDNTLWGGVIGEDGLTGIQLGHGAAGEAYVRFQEYLRDLKDRGVLLAVASKNDPDAAREPFEKHPDMVLRLDDFAAFHADWSPKSTSIRKVADRLGLGLDSFVFVDDNPLEREEIRSLLPDVEVVALPPEPSGYARALDQGAWFEVLAVTAEDAGRTAMYRARAAAGDLREQASTLEEFWASLRMEATVAPFDELRLPRVEQLVGRSNQFNLTTRRHSRPALEAMVRDPACVHRYLELRDRFSDHGLVGVVVAYERADVLDVDTFLMSCRVLGRTVETAMLHELCEEAIRRGCARLRGMYVPSGRNSMVADLYQRHGFRCAGEGADGATVWEYDLAQGPIESRYVTVRAT